MAKEHLAVLELLMNIVLGKTDRPGHVDFFPQKPPFPSEEPYLQPFPRATPESQGIPSDMLSSMIRKLDSSRYTDMHHLMILRHGNVICECNFAPYRSGIWHITHSMCKSITSMAIGMLIEEGLLSLDENIYKIFEDHMNPFMKIFRSTVTVENLLTMTSGVSFNESGIVSGNDWLGSYLNSPVIGRPGETFQYNSLNTYVLSAIVTERTGVSLSDYLKPRLFEPLGITRYFWETCPKGITKGGWGLFMCAEDMAKLGQLYLQKGMWNGRQLIPEHWIETSTSKHVDSINGTYGYGYQIWMEERPESFEFNGMLGQNVIVYPDMDMVIVTNAGNNELFQNCVMLNIIREFFSRDFHPEKKLPENPSAQFALKRLCAETESGHTPSIPVFHGGWTQKNTLHRRNSWKPEKTAAAFRSSVFLKTLNQKIYTLIPSSVGLFPLVMQVFHNNMTDGISRLSFSYEKGKFYVLFEESGEWHKLEVGFGRAAETTLTIHEESYLTGVKGTFTFDENHTPVLKLEISYLEECMRRLVNIFFLNEDEIEIKWFESPGKEMIMQGIESITGELTNQPLYRTLVDSGNIDLLYKLMGQTIEPVVYGALELPELPVNDNEALLEDNPDIDQIEQIEDSEYTIENND